MLANWDELYDETRETLSFKDKTYNEYINNIKDKNKIISSQSEMRTVKILNIFNNTSNKNKVQFIKQAGENHPDIKLKYKGTTTNIEVTKITQPDNRFEGEVLKDGGFNFNNPDDVVEHDKTKLMLTSKIKEKAEQYEKWINKGIIKSTEANIIAIDCGDLFPTTPVGPLLFSAYNFFKDILEYQFDLNNKLIKIPLVSPRDCIHKEKLTPSGEKEQIAIYNGEISEVIRKGKIDGIFAFFCSMSSIDLQIIRINNNPLLDDLYYYLSSNRNMDVNILRHGVLY